MRKIAILILLFAFAAFLRLYKIETVPMGLYVDEASVAYNAYQILTTGKDEHGVAHPFAFQAFGEYKMPVFVYMTSLSMALFGKNEFAIRIPSAFFGSLTVVIFYFFTKELSVYAKKLQEKYKEIFAYVSTLLLAISPWHIQFSRAGFEAIVALFFFLCGMCLFLLYFRKQKSFLLLSSFMLFIFSMYSYNAFRVVGLVSFVTLLLFALFRFPTKRKYIFIAGLCGFLLSLPMILFSFTNAGQARFMQVTTFSGNLGKFVYPLEYLNNYLAHFSLSFLFSYGDEIGRHVPFRMGPVFKWEIFFLFAGIYFLIREKISFFTSSILFLLLISPIAASVALPSPHILRSLSLVFPLTLIVSYGILMVLQNIKRKYILIGIILLVGSFELFSYLDHYYNFAPVTLADWGGQYKELLTTLEKDKKPDTVIIFNNNVGMSYVYQKFYYPDMKIQYVDDAWVKSYSLNSKNILYVTSAEEKQPNIYLHSFPYQIIDRITVPDKYHSVLYNISKI